MAVMERLWKRLVDMVQRWRQTTSEPPDVSAKSGPFRHHHCGAGDCRDGGSDHRDARRRLRHHARNAGFRREIRCAGRLAVAVPAPHLGFADHPGECRSRRAAGPASPPCATSPRAISAGSRRGGPGRHAGTCADHADRGVAAIPVLGGRLQLGTWQGVYLIEHRARPHQRHIVLQFTGSGAVAH